MQIKQQEQSPGYGVGGVTQVVEILPNCSKFKAKNKKKEREGEREKGTLIPNQHFKKNRYSVFLAVQY
jgi:hypothetical protein